MSNVNNSNGVNSSDGVNWSDGVINSYGVDKAFFIADKPRQATIFGMEVTSERYEEVVREFKDKCDGWFPKFNKAFELYAKSGNDWKKVKASEITSTLADWGEPYEAWKDMPQAAIDYVKSLPEFDAKIFKRVTGIDVTGDCSHSGKYNYCPNCRHKLGKEE